MSHSVAYDAEVGLIIIQFHGPVRLPELEDVIQEVATLVKAQQCFRILNNFREATAELSIMEIHLLPHIIADTMTDFGLPNYEFRRALVGAEVVPGIRFFENVSRMKGQLIKVFEDIDLAKQWLKTR